MSKPFIQWAGGKTQLLPEILPRVPTHFKRYVEPFVGGGAVLFNLPSGILNNPVSSVINDVNQELVNCYRVVQRYPALLLSELNAHASAFALLTAVQQPTYYYGVRDMDRDPNFHTLPPETRAARFIFLNKTCFNGLYRVNKKGYMNTPYGTPRPFVVDSATIWDCHAKLKNTQILSGSFKQIAPQAGDFFFIDPPYIPLTATANFTGYSQGGFTMADQQELASYLKLIDNAGARFLLTNHNVPAAHALYSGFNIETVRANRCISSKAAGRKTTVDNEIIVRNF